MLRVPNYLPQTRGHALIFIYFSDIKVNYNGKTYTLVPSQSGDFDTVKEICQSKGLTVFEPRDKETYYTIYKETEKAGMLLNFLNMKRNWLQVEQKWEQ